MTSEMKMARVASEQRQGESAANDEDEEPEEITDVAIWWEKETNASAADKPAHV